jgi:hypothetical protein
MRDLIPHPVFESIQRHLAVASKDAVAGWENNREDEDSLTGDLGKCLRTKSDMLINVGSQAWRYRVTYKKFRGRGDDAFEHESGADGIIQVEATLRDETYFKGLLFQAKKGERLRNGDLRGQLEKIEKMAPGGSAIVLYGPSGYFGLKGTEYLNSDENLVGPAHKKMLPLGSFFDEFLECKNGLRGMYYEAVRGRLVLPTIDLEIKAVQLDVRHRIKIEIAGG